MKELKDYSTQEILTELLRREETDNSFYLENDTVTSYMFKFWKTN